MPAATDLVALDIGGANLKAADGLGWATSVAFPLWKRWRELPEALADLVAVRRPEKLVATMTGEICDCYASRAEGVARIVESLAAAAATIGCPRPPAVYLVDGRLVPVDAAVRDWSLAAASNWHVLARLAAALVPRGRSLLVDVGSTTTDIVPLADAVPAPLANDDAGRMLSGELVYTGVERTAVAAIVHRLPHRGLWRPVASELFAESRDAWLLTGGLADDPDTRETADGGPSTAAAARVRLARMMLLDPDELTSDEARVAASWIVGRQATQVARAIRRVVRAAGGPPAAVVLSGHGDRLAESALDRTGWNPAVIRLADAIGPAAARAAPAHALARIAREARQ